MKKSSLLTITLLIGITVFLGGFPVHAADPPAKVKIERLTKYFAPVEFDHASHVEMIGGCTECHHHTTGTEPSNAECVRCHGGGKKSASVACQDCHAAEPFSAAYVREQVADRFLYHLDKPGLKGAYHMNCVGCHRDSGGPVDCADCHARTDAGEQLYRTGKYSPKPGHAAAGH